jgi:dephospho-CoA kinase
MVTAGLTGSFGMGKSTVSKMFAQLGAKIINTDSIVNNLLTDPDIIKRG